MGPILSEYSWNVQQFGGQFEAKSVASILPGVGSLANAKLTKKEANAMPFGRDVDEADVPRTDREGAGAITHYHNLTFYASRDLDAGSEIFVHYDAQDEWYKDRVGEMISKEEQEMRSSIRELDWLMEHGICVDNLLPDDSKIKGAGRGAFATRFIPKGAIVAPAPLVPIDRNAIVTKRIKSGGKIQSPRPQLLVNYCLGHVNSSILFYPTSPVVNLINHGMDQDANVRLQWSSSSSELNDGIDWANMPLEELKARNYTGVVMEYVATRDIKPKEEILLDYGLQWIQAWEKHKADWKPPPNAEAYSPSYVMDDVAGLLRTEQEQMNHPYPTSAMTTCFYRYSTHERNDGIIAASKQTGEPTVVKWKMDRQTFDYSNLRPCSIMQREDIDGHIMYTAMIKNWHGLKKEEMIPKGEMHVVNSIPRNAIRFVDKMYSTDQHLSNAFRHEAQIPDDMFPSEWMDLLA